MSSSSPRWTRRGSGSVSSTAWCRSDGSTANGSTKAASKGPGSRSDRCSRNRTDGVGGHRQRRPRCTSRSAPGPRGGRRAACDPRRAVRHARGLPDGGAFVTDVKGTPLFSAGVQDPQAAAVRRATTGRFVREPRSITSSASTYFVNGGFFVSRSAGRVFINLGRETAMMQRKPDGTWSVDKRCSRGSAPRRSAGSPPTATSSWLQFSDGRLVRYDTSQKIGHAASRAGADTSNHRKPRTSHVFGRTPAAPTRRLKAAPTACGSSTRCRRTSTRPRPSISPGSTASTPTGRRGRAKRQREYTNLGFGDYNFRVRARGISGAVSDEAVYAFTILPPWYRTWWAYGGYVAARRAACFGVDAPARGCASSPRSASARSSPRRSCAPKRPSRSRDRERGQEERRAAERDGPRDHRVARLRHDLRQALRAREPARRCRRVRRRPLPPGAPRDRVPPGDREGQAVRAVHARHDATATSCRSGASSTASRCSSTTSPAESPPLHQQLPTRRASRSRTARCRSAPQSMIYLPLVSQGPRARHHHDPELREERLHGASPERDAEPGVVHGHRARQRRTPTGSSTSRSTRSGGCSRRPRRRARSPRKPTPPRARSSPRSATSCARRSPRCSASRRSSRSGSRIASSRSCPTDDRKVAQTMQQVEDNLKVVVSEGERLTKLIDDVLDLAKIEAGKLEWHMEAGRPSSDDHRSRDGRHVVALRAEGPAPREARRARTCRRSPAIAIA